MLTLTTLTILSETAESSFWDVDHLLVLSNLFVILATMALTYYTRRACASEHKDDNRTILAVVRAFLHRQPPRDSHGQDDSHTETESF